MTDDDPPESPPENQDSAAAPSADDSSNSRRRESKESRIRREQREADAFWNAVFDTATGRREMWKIIAGSDGAHAFETRFMSGAVGFPDNNASWYARGEQDVGLRLYHAWLKRDPLSVAAMHQENDPRFAKPKRTKAGE